MTGSTISPRSSRWSRLALIMGLLLGMLLPVHAEVVRTFNNITPLNIPQVANPIGSQAGDTRSTLGVSGIIGSVTKISVSMYITHYYPQDLQIRLVPPNPLTGAAGEGDGIVILDDIYSSAVPITTPDQTANSGDNQQGGLTSGIGTGFALPNNGRVALDDVIGVVIDRGDPDMVNNVRFNVYLKSGTYRSQGNSLTTLNGLFGNGVNGVWTLLVRDQLPRDSGTLRAWSLTITEPGEHTWTGADFANNTNWSNPLNWVDGNVPSNTERNALIVFPDDVVAAGSRAPTRDVLPGAGVLSIGNLRIAEGYTLGGIVSTLGAGSNITITPGTGANAGADVTINTPLNLEGTTTLAVDTGMTLNLNGQLSNAGGATGAITKTGAGTAVLGAVNNQYSGVTTVSAGILDFVDALSLGTAAGGTVVDFGATLLVSGAVTIANEPLTINGTGTAGQGALSGTANCTWNGPITLGLTGTTGVGAAGGVNVTLGAFAAATGTRTLAALGTGTVTLNGALPAGAVTNLSVSGGTLVTTTAPQPSVGSLTLNSGTITPTAAITVGGSITATGTGSTLGAGTIILGGSRGLSVANGTAPNDLTVTATFSNGSLNKSGTGTVLWNGSNSPGVGMSLNAGSLTGNGTLGNLTVGRAQFAPTGAFTVDHLSLSGNSWLLYSGQQINADSVNIAGGVLQPTTTGTIIAVATADPALTVGEFAFYPRSGTAVIYTDNGNDVATGAALNNGSSATFDTITSYSAREGDGPIQLALTLTGPGPITVAITSAGGGLSPVQDFVPIDSLVLAGATTVPLTINDDFVAEGTESGQLLIIPLSGGVAGSPSAATLTITDNDGDDTNTCGFGTGLTVFLLLGFGLLLHVRLRRP